MKSARILTITLLLLVAVTVSLQAQERAFAKATIPFAFTVENVTLPAGTYLVSNLAPYSMIKVQNADGRYVAMVKAISSEGIIRSSETKLVFHQVSGSYFLAQVWEQGSGVRRDVAQGKLAVELARSGKPLTTATVLAGTASGR